MKNNIQSEIFGGILLCCNGTIALKRIDTGEVTIEGCLSEEYFKFKNLLYEQYAIVYLSFLIKVSQEIPLEHFRVFVS